MTSDKGGARTRRNVATGAARSDRKPEAVPKMPDDEDKPPETSDLAAVHDRAS